MSDAVKPDYTAETGAMRSADVDHLDFASLPLLAFLGVMKIAGCGGAKYGRFNYALGMPVHKTINHAIVHVIRWLLGDRSEDHLSKAAWGLMVANQTATQHPGMADAHVLGKGATITAAMLTELANGKALRDKKRQAGEFEDLFNWTLGDMPEVQEILEQMDRDPRISKEFMTNAPMTPLAQAESERRLQEQIDRFNNRHMVR